MIVVLGTPAYRPGPGGTPGTAAGLAADIACAAAAAGARVELAGRVGYDATGDALLLALARAGVGHAATLRDPTRGTVVVADAEDDGAPLIPLPEAGTPEAIMPVGHPAEANAGELDNVLDAGDVDLALGYLIDARVVVVAQPLGEAAASAAERSAFAGAALVAVVSPGEAVPAALDRAIVFERDAGAGEAFATLVGRFAASLDAGSEPAEAFGETRAALGWAPATD